MATTYFKHCCAAAKNGLGLGKKIENKIGQSHIL